MKEEILKIAYEMQLNVKDEADAIMSYTTLLDLIIASNLDDFTKQDLVNIIEEIISDELNHQEKLMTVYSKLTEIEPNKD